MSSHTSTLRAIVKLTLLGAALAGLVWMVGIAQPDGTVKESQADILDLNMVDLSNSARFSRGLKNLDHPEPRTFEMNGNIMHFSTRESRKRPEQLVGEYQEEFVRQGLNDRVWDAPQPGGKKSVDEVERVGEMNFSGMTGSVVPFGLTRDYAHLGGVVPANGADDPMDTRKLRELSEDLETPRDLFKGHYSIEMFWDQRRRKSRITASWSDDNFDYAKAIGKYEGSESTGSDPELPACPGCERINQMREIDGQAPYSDKIFVGDRGRDELLNFYRKVLPRRGWKETGASGIYRAARPYVHHSGDEANLAQFAKGNQFITVLTYTGQQNKTNVHVVRGQ